MIDVALFLIITNDTRWIKPYYAMTDNNINNELDFSPIYIGHENNIGELCEWLQSKHCG